MGEKRILVIDDEPEFVKAMQIRLGQAGYKVLTANSPPEATRVLRREKPDLILLDIGMPMHDGRRFCTYLKTSEQYKDIPVLIVSAKTKHEVKWAAEMSEADGYITKPFESKELCEQIEKLLEKLG